MAQPDVNVKGFTLAQKMVGKACGVDGVVPGASWSLIQELWILGFWAIHVKFLIQEPRLTASPAWGPWAPRTPPGP